MTRHGFSTPQGAWLFLRAGLALVAGRVAATDLVEGFSIGFIGPFTNWRHAASVGAVAFDLDLRKNFEPALQERFGPPIVTIPNMHPILKNVTVQMGTTHGSSETGLKTAIDWFQGTGGTDKVVGIVGTIFSSIAMPIASTAAVFKVPQVAFGATSPELSDKTRFPFFARVAAPDNILAKAFWRWKEHFQVPSLVVFYTQESYGTGFYESLRVLASEAGALDLLLPIIVENEADDAFTLELYLDGARRVRATGSRFVLIVATNRANLMYGLEQEGMLYGGQYQFVCPDQTLSQSEPSPSRGFPPGYQVITALAQGPLYNRWLDFWTKLTPDDMYNADAQQRYKHDLMKVPYSGDSPLAVTENDFTLSFFNGGFWVLPARSFDAGYSIVLSINNLLNKGVPPEEVQGQRLLDELRAIEFDGVTTVVSFDENGDLAVDYGLYTAETYGGDLTLVGNVNPGKGTVELHRPEGILWGNAVWNTTLPMALLSCDPGYQWNDQLGRCNPCPDGFFSEGGELPKCTACAVGTTSNENADACLDCRTGWFNSLPGGTCSRCAPGEYSANAGASACSRCEVGTFAEQPGSVGCKRCGEGHSTQDRFTTMASLVVSSGNVAFNYVNGATSEQYCTCDRGSRNSSSGECVPCTEGLECPGMGTVLVKEGYYSGADLSVYRCYGDTDRCPGGRPGESCAKGRTDLVCAQCENGKTPGTGGTCEECGGSDQAPFAVAVLLIFGCLAAAYYAIDNHNRATQSHALLICTFALSQFVTTVQQIGVVGMLNFEWRDPLKGFVNVLSVLILNFEVLRLSCVGDVEPFSVYLMKVLAIFVVLLLVVVIHSIFVITRHKGKFRKQTPVLISAVGTVFMVCYISVTSAVMEPWQCLSHPNDKWTMREYLSIVCWETGEHAAMLVLGTIMFLLVPIGFIVCTCIIVREFPKRLRRADSRAVKAFSFLFFRFRPGCHQYVLVFVLRSFFVALALVIPDLLMQVLILIMVLQAGFAVILLWRPWRVMIANVLEAVLACATMLLIALGAAFIPEEDTHAEGVAEVAVVGILLALALVPVVASYGIWRRFFRVQKPYEFFLCHYKVGSGAWTRLLKFHLLDSKKVKSDVFIDSDNLDHLDHLFNYVGNDTGTLVVVGTLGIFQRPWCLGEMCTARLKSVTTVLISLPSFQLPEESFVNELASKMNNLETLIESGMSIEMLQATLQWIASVPKVIVPPMVTVPVMDSVAGALVNKTHKAIMNIEVHAQKPADDSNDDRESALICDHGDMEALATCCVLRRMLTANLADELQCIPTVVDVDSRCNNVSMALIICTNLAFTRFNFLKHLGQLGSSSSVRLLPIIAQSGFQIPGKSFGEQLHDNLRGTGNENMHATLVTAVSALFKKIGATFEAGNASETVLQASAADIAKQIRGWFGTVRTTTSSAGRSNRGSESSRGQLLVDKTETSTTVLSADDRPAAIKQTTSLSVAPSLTNPPVPLEAVAGSHHLTHDWDMDL